MEMSRAPNVLVEMSVNQFFIYQISKLATPSMKLNDSGAKEKVCYGGTLS